MEGWEVGGGMWAQGRIRGKVEAKRPREGHWKWTAHWCPWVVSTLKGVELMEDHLHASAQRGAQV